MELDSVAGLKTWFREVTGEGETAGGVVTLPFIPAVPPDPHYQLSFEGKALRLFPKMFEGPHTFQLLSFWEC